ncbi:MAG: response regulator [Betaproteobacteria bacterium]|nr:response regulator [Betaproteobacteria bacterium]
MVTDYNMPGRSGLDIAREVHAIRADLPVVLASGFIDDALHAAAAAAGVKDLIFKTDAVEDFSAVVQRLTATNSPASWAEESRHVPDKVPVSIHESARRPRAAATYTNYSSTIKAGEKGSRDAPGFIWRQRHAPPAGGA